MGEQATDGGSGGPYPRLRSVGIKGYRPFRDFSAKLGPLEVIAGANGSGKSALFEFLRFLRDGMDSDIPPGIVPGYVGQRVLHVPGADRLEWDLGIDIGRDLPLTYLGTLMGHLGRPRVTFERVDGTAARADDQDGKPCQFLHFKNRKGVVIEPDLKDGQFPLQPQDKTLYLRFANHADMVTTYNLRSYIGKWRFYGSFGIDQDGIRRPNLVEQEPVLREDASNVCSVLHFLMTEHPAAFDELQECLRLLIPEFRGLKVKARGGPGEVVAFWKEDSGEKEFTLADLSDGMLSLICWTLLCVQPDPPPLICIDEPELGLHPRTLPVLAGLFDKASDRTQIILATHSSYFLTQFDITRIAVMRKENGEAKFAKPGDSKALTGMLEEFGPDEIETMHRSEELEFLA